MKWFWIAWAVFSVFVISGMLPPRTCRTQHLRYGDGFGHEWEHGQVRRCWRSNYHWGPHLWGKWKTL